MSLLKVTRQEVAFISFASAFHIRGAETEKVLSPCRLRDGGVIFLYSRICANKPLYPRLIKVLFCGPHGQPKFPPS